MSQKVPEQNDPDAQLRSALQDAAAVIRRLAPLCKSPGEVVDLIELALVSDGQLALIKRELQPVALKQ